MKREDTDTKEEQIPSMQYDTCTINKKPLIKCSLFE